ncbi:hypothetical protein CN918_28235 [Priestia megaterium]|nr:hypothetical protein CN918_28235 [Priestia megaterium]
MEETKRKVIWFWIKCGLSVLLAYYFLTQATVRFNGSTELSFGKVVMLIALSLVPFGWSVLNEIQSAIWDTVYTAIGRKKDMQKGFFPSFKTVDILLFVVFFPFRLTAWLIQFFVSIPIGVFAFPVACYLSIPLTIKWINEMRDSYKREF